MHWPDPLGVEQEDRVQHLMSLDPGHKLDVTYRIITCINDSPLINTRPT
jgi:hypothetical protein